MATNKKKQKLSIYLLKKDIKQFVSALKNRRDVDEYKLKGTLKLDGIIYIGKTKEKDFAWQYFLQDGTDKQIPELKNASNRAVLMMRIEGRIYVLPFGFGKHLIREDTIEREFGLKAALNMVDPDKLRSIDKANLDDLTVLTKTQTSRRAKPQEFNIDVVRDLMRGVTGEPSSEYEKLGTVVTGSEGVYTIPLIEFEDIPDHLRMLKKGYQSRAYKARFDWVDNLKYERDPTTIESLQDKLIEALKSKDLNNIHLSPPVMIEWEGYEGISFTAKGDLQSELDISSFYNTRNDDLRELDWDKLKRQRLFIKYAHNNDAIPVSLISSLNFQVQKGSFVYVFAFSQWYRVNKGYNDKIVSYVNDLKESKLSFIDCENDMNNEGDYNKKLASSASNFKLFDEVFVKSDAIRSKVEVCDVFAVKEKEFIHVKFRKKSSVSSVLSHLFSQGKISGTLFARDIIFRKNLRAKFKEKGLPVNIIPIEQDKVDCSKYTITFAIIGDPTKTFFQLLPFFSLLNFMLTAQELRVLGFKVKVKKINQA